MQSLTMLREKCTTHNFRLSTFFSFLDYDSVIATADDPESSIGCKYRLSYDWNKGRTKRSGEEAKAGDTDEVQRATEATCISWSSTGSTIAASYGATDHDGWCDHTAGVCTWNIFKKGMIESEPDLVLEVSVSA